MARACPAHASTAALALADRDRIVEACLDEHGTRDDPKNCRGRQRGRQAPQEGGQRGGSGGGGDGGGGFAGGIIRAGDGVTKEAKANANANAAADAAAATSATKDEEGDEQDEAFPWQQSSVAPLRLLGFTSSAVALGILPSRSFVLKDLVFKYLTVATNHFSNRPTEPLDPRSRVSLEALSLFLSLSGAGGAGCRRSDEELAGLAMEASLGGGEGGAASPGVAAPGRDSSANERALSLILSANERALSLIHGLDGKSDSCPYDDRFQKLLRREVNRAAGTPGGLIAMDTIGAALAQGRLRSARRQEIITQRVLLPWVRNQGGIERPGSHSGHGSDLWGVGDTALIRTPWSSSSSTAFRRARGRTSSRRAAFNAKCWRTTSTANRWAWVQFFRSRSRRGGGVWFHLSCLFAWYFFQVRRLPAPCLSDRKS